MAVAHPQGPPGGGGLTTSVSAAAGAEPGRIVSAQAHSAPQGGGVQGGRCCGPYQCRERGGGGLLRAWGRQEPRAEPAFSRGREARGCGSGLARRAAKRA